MGIEAIGGLFKNLTSGPAQPGSQQVDKAKEVQKQEVDKQNKANEQTAKDISLFMKDPGGNIAGALGFGLGNAVKNDINAGKSVLDGINFLGKSAEEVNKADEKQRQYVGECFNNGVQQGSAFAQDASGNTAKGAGFATGVLVQGQINTGKSVLDGINSLGKSADALGKLSEQQGQHNVNCFGDGLNKGLKT